MYGSQAMGVSLVSAWRSALGRAGNANGESNAAGMERRAYDRPGLDFAATLQTAEITLQARGRNLNRGGALVVATAPLPNGSVVFFHTKSYELLGWAKVRWTRKCRFSGYYIGLEFERPLMRSDFGEWQFARK